MRASTPRAAHAGRRAGRLDRAAEARPRRRDGHLPHPGQADTSRPSAPDAAAPEPAAPAVGVAEPPPAPTRKRRRLLLLVPILAVVGALALYFGLRFWYESTYFVMTDNAQVTGDLVQVGSLNAGRIVDAHLEVGQLVARDEVIATVAVPQQVGTVPFGDTPLLDQTGSLNTQVPVRSPIDGVVAARLANVGGTVTAGQAIYALINPRQIWVNANVDEDKVERIARGEAVEIHSEALGRSFEGRVEAVTPASAATFSLLPAQNVSGNFNKVTQWVPVKVLVDSGDTVLPLGTSARVRIRVKEGGPLPWQR
jgi:multidrug resistance efflux pump